MHDHGSEGLRVNIGCGQSPCTGWVNFDSSPSTLMARMPHVALASDILARFNLLAERQASFIRFCRNSEVYFGDALKGILLPRASCTIVYASHVLEHLYRLDDAPRFLRECKRLLQSGGVLRLAVPDLRVYISQYEQKGSAEAFAGALHMNPSKRPSRWINLVTGNRSLHRWIYDQNSLTDLLRQEGFININSPKVGETSIAPVPDGLNLRERAWESLYVEAMKP